MKIDKQKNCAGCPCFDRPNMVCNIIKQQNKQPVTTILSDCPLPLESTLANHGNLIDRDKMIASLSTKSYCKNCNNSNCKNCSKRIINDTIIDYLNAQDIIIKATD